MREDDLLDVTAPQNSHNPTNDNETLNASDEDNLDFVKPSMLAYKVEMSSNTLGEIERDDQDDENPSDDLFEHLRIVTDKGQSPLRIDKFLTDRMANVSRTKIQNAIHAGAVTVNGQVVKPNFKISPNQTISLVLPSAPSDSTVLPEDLPLNVVYEDEDVLVINKPAGLVVHPGLGNPNGTLVNALAHYFKDRPLPMRDGIIDRPGLVHRIDKDTSGLMVVAKNDYAMQHLANQFFYHTIERRYWALVWGQPNNLEGTIDVNMGRHPMDRSFITTFPDGDEGKRAITHYKVLEPMYYVSLVECRLETGRTHQIRVHMKYLGHPLFQDERYGGHRIVKGTIFTKYKQFVQNSFKVLTRQALHAKTIGFEHPTTGEFLRFDSEMPEDMTNVLQRWRDYVSARRDLLERGL